VCVCVCTASSAATPPDAVPTTEAGARGSPAVPAEASAVTDEQGAVQDGNEIKKACLSSEEKSSEEKRGGRWEEQGRTGKGSAGQKKGLFKTVLMSS
jgi:hypothetical protein